MIFLFDFTLFVIDIHHIMLISLFPTPFDHFHFHPTFGLDPALILTLRLMLVSLFPTPYLTTFTFTQLWDSNEYTSCDCVLVRSPTNLLSEAKEGKLRASEVENLTNLQAVCTSLLQRNSYLVL